VHLTWVLGTSSYGFLIAIVIVPSISSRNGDASLVDANANLAATYAITRYGNRPLINVAADPALTKFSKLNGTTITWIPTSTTIEFPKAS
jgi:hypothetical protein